MKSLHPSENQLQYSCVDLLRKAGVQGLIWFSVPNEAVRGGVKYHFLRMGMLPGMTDLVIVLSGRSIFVELKHPIKGETTDEQKDVHKRLREQGFKVYIVRTIDRFQTICRDEGLIREAVSA